MYFSYLYIFQVYFSDILDTFGYCCFAADADYSMLANSCSDIQREGAILTGDYYLDLNGVTTKVRCHQGNGLYSP